MNLRGYIGHLIRKSMGTTSFIRMIEWRSILDWLDLEEGEKVLDVACGDGILSLKIAERGCSVYGIDISENAISRASQFAKRDNVVYEFQVGDAGCLPYPDGCFNKIVSSSSLEHFHDDIKALKEMNRVLRPNGTLVLTTDSLSYPIDYRTKRRHRRIGNVVNYYNSGKLQKRLEVCGFTMVRSKYLLNSRVTSFFYKIGIKLEWSGLLWMAICPIAYLLCSISDRLFGMKSAGYTLIAEAKKR